MKCSKARFFAKSGILSLGLFCTIATERLCHFQISAEVALPTVAISTWLVGVQNYVGYQATWKHQKNQVDVTGEMLDVSIH